MNSLSFILWVSTLVCMSQSTSAFQLRQSTCGNAAPINITAGFGQMLMTPNFPMSYPALPTCSWNFVTAPGGLLTLYCAISVPCTDSFVATLTSATNKTHCGVKALQEVATNSLSVNLRPATGTTGGYALCLVTASAAPATTAVPPTTPPPATTRPVPTSLPTTRTPITTLPPATTRPTTTMPPTTRPPATTLPPATTRLPATTAPTARPAVTTTASVTTRAPNPSCNCGIRGPNRIVGGSPAGQNEYPWMVMLLENMSGPFCGGSIIAPGWVATAAHCTFDISLATSTLTLVAGRYSVSTSSTTQQFRNVSKIIVHPSYDTNTQDNDISLLQLATPFTFNTAVSPICLPYPFPTFDFASQTGIGTGWGTTSSGGSSSSQLLEVTLPILSTSQCKQYPNVTNYISSNMICTYQPGKDTCQGDSGGPLNWVDPATQRVYLAGITSWGIGCAAAGFPGVYVKVNNYLTWIQQNTGLTFCSP